MLTGEETAIHKLVKTVHDQPGRLMLVTAGAGTFALAWLLGVPGASRTLIEAITLYEESSFNEFLGRKPEKYVEARTAGLLAGRAVSRARHLYKGAEPVIGLACTATIVTDRPKRGQHRAHIATWTARSVDRHALYLQKGARDRTDEEAMVSTAIINALARVYGLEAELPMPFMEGDTFTSGKSDLTRECQRLQGGERDFIGIMAEGRLISRKHSPGVILSGAFNPLHRGHLGLAKKAAELTGKKAVYELAAMNADKPALSIDDTLERMLQFAGTGTILASNAPLFVDKAKLYPGAIFVVGVDTAARILQPQFYGHSQDRMLKALDTISSYGCSFLVAGRASEDGTYRSAAALDIPDSFGHLFEPIPEDNFRIDISSTQLRSESVS